MAETIQIAIDAMGGEHAPDEIVAGAAALSLQAPNLHTILVGDSARIGALLERVSYDAARLSVHHAPEAIAMNESPQRAVADKAGSSLLVASRLVASGEAQALVTAGNAGAAILACARSFKLLPGVQRAALAAVYPTQRLHGDEQHPFSLLLDVGAGVSASADDLLCFAIMGAAYARAISSNPSPSVALLSNGTEASRGPPAVVQAHALLAAHPGLDFLGNIEGVDIPKGTADVVVCDGFTGNVVLRMLEGVGETIRAVARYAYKERLLWRAGMAMLAGGLRRVKELTDWQQYGGAPILGFDQVVIQAHGRSRAQAITNAGKVAAKAVSSGMVASMREGLAELGAPPGAGRQGAS